jgi:tetratricopeptide (TPR) repeat protein
MMRERLGSGHPAYALTLQKLGSALVSADRPAAAIKPREELVTLLSAQPLDDVGARLAEAHKELSLAIALSANKRAQLERALDHANKALQLHESGAVGRAPGRGAASSTVLAHARSANAVAGILERLGRDDEAVSTMGYAYQLAAAQADAEDEIEAEYVMQARRNLEGLKRKVRWKLKQASKVDEL